MNFELVVDCSVIIAWLFEDERTPRVTGVLDLIVERGAIVPSLWPIELANVLGVAERRKRCTQEQSRGWLAALVTFPISIEREPTLESAGDILRFAREHHLTAYDAMYAELAQRMLLPLATLDKRLTLACKAAGVNLIL